MGIKETEVYNELEEKEKSKITKHNILRKFVLNPKFMNSSTETDQKELPQKIQYLKDLLKKGFQTKKRVVVIVNEFIENILIWDHNIIEQMWLENEPGLEDLKTLIMYWWNKRSKDSEKDERSLIQESFNSEWDEKILLILNGSVCSNEWINLTWWEEVIFYNEPWNLSEKEEQIASVYWPWLKHEIEVHDIIVKNTIEEWHYRYVRYKQELIEKVMNWIPISEMNKKLLKWKDESIINWLLNNSSKKHIKKDETDREEENLIPNDYSIRSHKLLNND